jgi:hypothetical protein
MTLLLLLVTRGKRTTLDCGHSTGSRARRAVANRVILRLLCETIDKGLRQALLEDGADPAGHLL